MILRNRMSNGGLTMASLAAAVAREGAAFEAKDADDDIAAAIAASGRSANNLTICWPSAPPRALKAHLLGRETRGCQIRIIWPTAAVVNLPIVAEKEIHGEGGSHRKIQRMYE